MPGKRFGYTEACVLLASLLLASCTASPTDDAATGGGPAVEAGGAGGESTVGGLDSRCVVVSTTAFGWTEQTAAGTPEAAFASMSGACEAPFAWDATGWSGTLTVTPATGRSTLTATVTVDQTSARWVELGAAPDAPPAYAYLCGGGSLEVDATVTLELPDGTVVRDQVATLGVSAGQPAPTIDFLVDPASQGDWVSIAAPEGTSVRMAVRMTPIAGACTGEVSLSAETAQGSGMIGVAQAPFATWTDTGCGVGLVAVDLTQPFQGVDLVAAVTSAFDQVAFAGAWDGGGTTVLSLGTTVTATRACGETIGEDTVVTIPVDLVATTADGRLAALGAPGTVRVTVSATDLSQMQLGLSTDLSCASQTDTLPYHSADCATAQSVTAQLLYNQYTGSPDQDGGQLELYVYLRNTSAPPGAADRVDTLRLSP
jgi:hypothetical protein